MSREEQIEEIKRTLYKAKGVFVVKDAAQIVAETLYDADYRRVIMCKDCVYRDTEGCQFTYWDGGRLVSNVSDNDFCSGAKMKGR